MKTSTPDMDKLFNPNSLALIGASGTPGKIGTTVLFCITGGQYKGKIYPINPKETEIMGIKAYDKIGNVPDKVDLAIICVTANLVPQIVEECAEVGVKFGIVISSGFGEASQEGKNIQQQIVQIARQKGMRLVGPNCMGVGSATSSLYASMNYTIPTHGGMSLVSQSGTMATLISMGGSLEGIGTAKYISSGNEADLHGGDFLRYYATDPQTNVVVAFVEGVRDGQVFFEASKQVTKHKPLIVLKGGATKAGAAAASSHTGSLAGSDKVFSAMCSQAGIVRVASTKQAVDLAKAFSLSPLPKGRKTAVVSAQGGLGVLMADSCIQHGLELPDLSQETIEELDAFLPYFWNRGNPVDVTGGVGDFREITKALDIVLRQDDIHSAICLAPTFSSLFGPAASRMSETTQQVFRSMMAGGMAAMEKNFTNDMIEIKAKHNKPIIGISLLPASESEIKTTLESNGIPVYDTPDQIAYVLSKLADYREYREKNGYGI